MGFSLLWCLGFRALLWNEACGMVDQGCLQFFRRVKIVETVSFKVVQGCWRLFTGVCLLWFATILEEVAEVLWDNALNPKQ